MRHVLETFMGNKWSK